MGDVREVNFTSESEFNFFSSEFLKLVPMNVFLFFVF